MSRRGKVACCGAVALAAAPVIWLRVGLLPEGLLALDRHVSIEVVARQGEPLYERPSEEGARSRFLRADDLPAPLVHATLAAEDGRFFRHAGVDPRAVARAALHDLRAGGLRQGGSTITQQVAKLLIDRPRTLRGKLREVVVALRLEHHLGKREILALYLSLAPYGNGLVGARAASAGYFGCPPENLTPAQAAFLAGLPQQPSALDPRRNFEGAIRRQRWVLGRMGELGLLSPAELERARAERLRILPSRRGLVAPHFVQRVLSSLPPGIRRVETTLDAGLQGEVRGILEMHRERLQASGAANVAVAVLDNVRGEWLAWEGSGDYFDADHGGAIDGVAAPRQPGSALKPFTYALAFERGFTPASVLPDVPSHFPTAEEGVLYSPRNYDGRFRGPMRARLALGGSANVPAVWLIAEVGVPDLLRLLRRAGFTTLDHTSDHYGFALTMGDAEVRLHELVAGYSALARGGLLQRPRAIRRVVDVGGRVSEPERGPQPRIVSERAAYWVADILADPRARGWAFGHGGSLDFPFPVAVKTGTSQSYHDNWTVGFTRAVTVGVWVGNFDRRELRGSSGVTGAAPIFHDVLLAAQARVTGRLPGPADPPLADVPADLAATSICALSGMPAGEACPAVEREWLPKGAAPLACTWHDHAGQRRVVSGDRPAPARSHTAAEGLRILSPPDGAVYLRDPTLRASFQTLPLRAAGAPAGAVRWEVDGTPVGATAGEDGLDWPLAPGTHTVVATDERGRQDRSRIVVR